MNKIIAIAILGGAATVAFASFTESFDIGPTGWNDGSVTTFGNTAGGDDMVFSSGTWHAQNESVALGTTGWFNSSPSNSGAGALTASFSNTGLTGTINNWMMTPTISLANGDTFSFFTRTVVGATFPDRLLVKMSLSGASTATANFSTTLLTINPNLLPGTANYPDIYTQFSITVSGLASPTSGRLAFNYNVTDGGLNGLNSNVVRIDDVVYTSAPVPEPASLAVVSIGAVALLRRRKK